MLRQKIKLLDNLTLNKPEYRVQAKTYPPATTTNRLLNNQQIAPGYEGVFVSR